MAVPTPSPFATPVPTDSPPAPGDTPIPSGTTAVVGTSPGHGSPAAAVAGFLDAEMAGDEATACGYVVASERTSTCDQVMQDQKVEVMNAPLTFGRTYTLGSNAIVVLLGKLCSVTDPTQPASCIGTTNPSYGLPTSDAGFGTAFDNALNGFNPDNPCRLLSGKWYLDLGQLSSGQTGPIIA